MIVGIGSPHGDDQLGWVAVDLLRPRLPSHVGAVKARGGLALLEWLEGQERVIVVDAAAPSGRPGMLRSFVWPARDLEECAAGSTHGLGLVAALRLAQALGCLPPLVSIETVEAERVSPGAPLSEAVEWGVAALVESLLHRLARDADARDAGGV